MARYEVVVRRKADHRNRYDRRAHNYDAAPIRSSVIVRPVVIRAAAEIADSYFRDFSVPRALRLRVATGPKVAAC